MIVETSQIQLTAEHHKVEIEEQSRSHSGFLLAFDSARVQLSQARLSATNVDGGLLQTLAPPRANLVDSLGSIQPARPWGGGSAFPDLAWGNRALTTFATEGLGGAERMNPRSSQSRLFEALLAAITAHRAGLRERWPDLGSSASIDRATAAAPALILGDEGRRRDGLSEPGPLRAARSLEVEVRVRNYVREEECTHFCAAGTVTTQDGRQIDLRLDLSMAREYEAVTEYSRREMVEFTDPLVINFEGTSAELTAEKYAFDLDADGSDEWISFVDAHSSLLALDRNRDGQINDGTELFGALSDNGFAELAAFDSDGNGFIDAADPVFGQLQLWRREAGEDRLETLAERNLGAIYLGATETPFDLKDESNQTLGRVRQSGIYLEESGAVGSVQQVDLAV